MNSRLAIIIPAYKSRFLQQALSSLATQTCKDFVVYIGDDASNENLWSIVEQYNSLITIEYRRFEENLGGKSLTKQWERCINLSANEPYIWVFSDDDEVTDNAVRYFYDEITRNEIYDVYRFNLNIINEKSEIVKSLDAYPSVQTDFEFFHQRVRGSIYSCITQFIFTREIFNRYKFVDFPVAWSSDDATIIMFSREKGIKNINGGFLNWRLVEGSNITSSVRYEKEKVKAEFLYARWFNDYFKGRASKKELKNITLTYFNKRLSALPFKYYLSWNRVYFICKTTGIVHGTKVIFRNIYNKLRDK